MSSYKSCDYTPISETIARDEQIEQMSIDPSRYYACNPYGNAAAIEAMGDSLASNTAPTAASRAAEEAGPALPPWPKSPQMLADEDACQKANDNDDLYWMKQMQDVTNPVKQPSIPLKLLQWLVHPGVAC